MEEQKFNLNNPLETQGENSTQAGENQALIKEFEKKLIVRN